MKKVFIDAYTSVNLGDDLFIKILCERYPRVQFYTESKRKNKKVYEEFENLKCYSNINFFLPIRGVNFLLRKIGLNNIKFQNPFIRLLFKTIDAYVYLGGSIFAEKMGWEHKIRKQRKLVSKYKLPTYFLGCNFGPFNTNKFRDWYFDLFKKCIDICFREEYSYTLFKDLNNVRKADDIVFNLNYKNKVRENRKKNLVISVIDLEGRNGLEKYEKRYLETIVKVCELAKRNNLNVILMSFCGHEGDEKGIRKILKQLPENSENISHYYYKGDINEALEILASAEYILATRFHSLVLAMQLGVPFFPLSYSEKIINILNDYNYKSDYLRIADLEKNSADFIFNSILKQDTFKLDKQRENSKQMFNKLDELLLKEEC